MVEWISWIEQCGYQVEPSAKLPAEYLTIFKNGKPIGFLFQDGDIHLLNGLTQDTEKLRGVVAFGKRYKGLEKKDDAYILMRYMQSFVTVQLSPDTLTEMFILHIVEESGEVQTETCLDKDTAIRVFLRSSGAVSFKEARSMRKKESLWDRGMRRIAERYLKKQTNA